MVVGSNPTTPINFVNDFVNELLAMVYSQGNSEKITEFMTIGGRQIGTPKASQKWVDDFLASRRQGVSELLSITETFYIVLSALTSHQQASTTIYPLCRLVMPNGITTK